MTTESGLVKDSASGGVILPSGTHSWAHGVSLYAQWRDSFEHMVLDAIAKGVRPRRWERELDYDNGATKLPVLVALVPEPANKENSDSILIWPVSAEGSVLGSGPIGYMFEHHLSYYARTIQQLAGAQLGPVLCRAMVAVDTIDYENQVFEWHEDDLSERLGDGILPLHQAITLGWQASHHLKLDLMYSDDLIPLVDAWLEANPPTSGSPENGASPEMNLLDWHGEAQEAPVGALALGAGKSGLVITHLGGIEIARVMHGKILCDVLDETQRPRLTDFARAAGATVLQGIPSGGEALPRVLLRWSHVVEGSFTIHHVNPRIPVASLPIVGAYDPVARQLAGWRKLHLEPLRRSVLRHGFEVSTQILRKPPHDVVVHNLESLEVSAAGVPCDRPINRLFTKQSGKQGNRIRGPRT